MCQDKIASNHEKWGLCPCERNWRPSDKREREREGKQRGIGRGCCMNCIVSELVQHCTKRLMMHLGILVEPIERRRVLGERLTLALQAVHSYSAGFNLICWSKRDWFNAISMFICIDILCFFGRLKFLKYTYIRKGKKRKTFLI